jgi:phosphatidylinositol alpha-1,6-mannosyltransferase
MQSTKVPASRARWWLVTRKYPRAPGGMERQSFELTTRLSRRRPTTVVTIKPSQSLSMFFAVVAIRIVVGCLKGDVLLLHLGDGVLAPLALIARLFRVPTIITLHGLDVVHDTPSYRAWRRTLPWRADHYVCVSEATRAAAVARGIAAERTTVIHNGVDSGYAAVPTRERSSECLLFVGRLVRRKGLAWFIRAVLPPLVKNRPGLQLVVIGDGPERENIIRAAREAGVEAHLSMLGAVDDTEKIEWLALASACVLPNIQVDGDIEGFGLVALEAASAGCMVFAAAIEGLREAVVDGVTGTLVPAQDATAWITAIGACLDDPAAGRRAGGTARSHVQRHFGWDGVVDAYEALFTRFSGNGRRTADA